MKNPADATASLGGTNVRAIKFNQNKLYEINH
jgi:hypothetical protein